MSEKKAVGRRMFLVGLATGAGVVTALGAAGRKPAGKKITRKGPGAEPILYRRTEEAQRYYRTLYV
jgi:hypothetical protein